MNKAFVREPDGDGEGYCPRCGALGVAVTIAPMDTHIRPETRARMGEAAWFCCYARCEVAYFNVLESVVTVAELRGPIYPKNVEAPICACFGFTLDEIEADVREGAPRRIRELLEKSKSPEAHCATLTADGRCCMREVQRLYMKLRQT